MSNVTASPSFSTIPALQLPQYLDMFAKSVVSTVNGNLDFGNFNCQLITVNFPNFNTLYAFPHTLGRIPIGYIRYGGNFNGAIWEQTKADWTASSISLLCGSIGYANLILF